MKYFVNEIKGNYGNSYSIGLSVLSDVSVRASGRVIKNSAQGGAEFAIFNNSTGSEY